VKGRCPSVPTAAGAGGAQRSSVLDVTLSVCGVLWSVWLLVPWVPRVFVQRASDAGYVIFSHIAFAQGEPWGSSTLHTSGPLGFLRFPFFYRPTYVLLLLGNAAIAAAVALLLYHLTGLGVPTWARLPFVAGATWTFSLSDDPVWLFALLVSQLLIPGVSRSQHWSLRPDPRWLTWPLLLDLGVCAVAANVKGSFLLMAGVLAAELTVLELRGRRAPALSASFVLLVAVLARLAGMRIGDWGPYTKHIIGSLSGYAESFSQAGPRAQGGVLIMSVFLFLAFAAFHAWHSPDRFEALVRWGALATLVWMVAKGPLIRQDGIHQLRAITSLGAFFAIYVVARRDEWGLRGRVACLLPALALSALFVVVVAGTPPRRLSIELRLNRFSSFLREGMAAPTAKDARARNEAAAKLQSAWSPTGSVAVFGTDQSLLLGHSGRRVALPIVASYEIWSPWTSRREREFLMGPDAPDYLLYTASPASGELALALAARYSEAERRPHYGLLRRRPAPLDVNKRVVFESSVDAGHRIEIPPDWRKGPAIAEVRYTKTLTNTLISAVYQPPEAFLVLFKGPTTVAKIRMNSLLSAEGIVLSSAPGVWDGKARALHGIRFGLLTDERVDATALGFEARGLAGNTWTRYFGPRIHVRIYIPELG
jgi:hypothetical protein